MNTSRNTEIWLLSQPAELNRELVEVHSAEAAGGSHLEIREVVGVQVPPRFGYVGIEGYGIGAGDHRFLQRYVFKIASSGAVAKENAISVKQSDRGKHEVGQIGQTLVDLLMETVALAAEDAVPVLHAKSDADQAVVLGDREIDDLVGFKEWREDGPAFQDDTAKFDFAVELGIGKDDLRSLRARSGLDTGALKAAARFVATDVGDDDAFGAGLPALADDLGHYFRIGVGGLLRSAVPRDVGLENDYILATDEAADAAQVSECALDQSARFTGLRHWVLVGWVIGDRQVGQLRAFHVLIGLHAMVAAGLLSACWGRAEAVLA
jgi:hypothetical protein